MFHLIIVVLCVYSIEAAPGYDLHGLGLDYGLHGAPLIAAPQLLPSPYLKTLHEPIYAPSIYAPAPLLAHPPILEHAPIFKTIAPVAPVIKAVAPATSYATVTSFHIAHPAPILKTIIAPQPILKSYIPGPIAYGHGYH